MKTFKSILFVMLILTAGAAAIFAIIKGNAILAWVISMCIVWLAFDILYDKLKIMSMSDPLLIGMLIGQTIKELREEHKYTEADLVKFGKYLLSEQREQSIENKENLREVTDADIANAFEKRHSGNYN